MDNGRFSAAAAAGRMKSQECVGGVSTAQREGVATPTATATAAASELTQFAMCNPRLSRCGLRLLSLSLCVPPSLLLLALSLSFAFTCFAFTVYCALC